jgi:hypothetical protein
MERRLRGFSSFKQKPECEPEGYSAWTQAVFYGRSMAFPGRRSTSCRAIREMGYSNDLQKGKTEICDLLKLNEYPEEK